MTKLQKNITKTIPLILKRHGVKRAALFGSVARGEDTAKSDIDLLVEFKGKKSLFDLISLELDLTKRYRRKVDVTTFNALSPLLRKHVLKDQQFVYGQRP